jgi:hypothetical protein
MNEHDAETVREIGRLRTLAQRYRDWAALSGSSPVRENRLRLADHIDARARALLRELPHV